MLVQIRWAGLKLLNTNHRPPSANRWPNNLGNCSSCSTELQSCRVPTPQNGILRILLFPLGFHRALCWSMVEPGNQVVLCEIRKHFRMAWKKFCRCLRFRGTSNEVLKYIYTVQVRFVFTKLPHYQEQKKHLNSALCCNQFDAILCVCLAILSDSFDRRFNSLAYSKR